MSDWQAMRNIILPQTLPIILPPLGLGKGGLPVIASLAVPSLSLVMSPITAAGLLLRAC